MASEKQREAAQLDIRGRSKMGKAQSHTFGPASLTVLIPQSPGNHTAAESTI